MTAIKNEEKIRDDIGNFYEEKIRYIIEESDPLLDNI